MGCFDCFIWWIAGIIGARKKGANNIVPGVAIATALMPPLCTAGYSIASGNFQYFIGSSYLFLINCVFITLTSFVGVKVMKWLSHSQGQPSISFFRKPTLKEVLMIILVVVLIIPSVLSAKQMVDKSTVSQNIQLLVRKELGNVNLIKQKVDEQNKTINLAVSGSKISAKKIQGAKHSLSHYHLKGYSLNIIQVAQVNPNAENQLDRQVNNILNQRRQIQDQKNEERQQLQEARNSDIKKISKGISSVTSVSDSKNNQILLIELNNKVSREKKNKLKKRILKKYKNIKIIEFIITK